MDSLTQALLGAAVAGAAVPQRHTRKALLAGALLGTLPDLDVVIRYESAVANFTQHRGFSHSIFVLAPFSVVLWLLLRRWWAPVRDAPAPWFAAISLALLTHTLLDAHTAYGTQLLWPLETPPVMWATLFIIDPLFTLPLLLGVLLGIVWPAPRRLRGALLLSTAYIGWSWVASTLVLRTAEARLADVELTAPLFVTPTPFNTLLWRIVARTPDGYLEGFDSLVAEDAGAPFISYECEDSPPGDREALDRLNWFASGLVCAAVQENQMVQADLRMGQAPRYVFSFAVAARGEDGWEVVKPALEPYRLEDRALGTLWRRIWSPDPALAPKPLSDREN
ncbi:MAG: metal-dependent hydrolase [Pseudomonadota bacterium]